MNRRQRHQELLRLIRSEPELDLQSVCQRLGVSPATARRDFARLAAEGLVERFWGSIKSRQPQDAVRSYPAFAERLEKNTAEKSAIAQAAASLLRDGDVVMIDGGTTTFQLCDALASKRVRVITNSLVIAHALDRRRDVRNGPEILLTGGILQPEAGVMGGPPAEDFIRRFHAQWVFLSAAGVNAHRITNNNPIVLPSEQLMLEQSDKAVLLVDQAKFGVEAMIPLCPLNKIHTVITGKHPKSSKALREIIATGIHMVQVPF